MSLQRLRGTHDIYGPDALIFQKIEATARQVFSRFGFSELRTPILEERDLFTRALGTETDVVQKEMYEFVDRSQTAVAMRPEGTAGVVRAYLENNFHKIDGNAKLYYMGPMFRSERPQAGRLRQFHQIGLEALGFDTPAADAEAIHALTVFLDAAGAGGYRVRLNNLGTFEERGGYREVLKSYFEPHLSKMCEDCKNRFTKNIFRLLDCKVETCRAISKKAPSIHDHLNDDSKRHFETVCRLLQKAGVAYEIDPYMVRGLDYYTKTVFEVSHSKLGAQDALGAGGRYDKLIETFGGPASGAVGFAVGMERLAMCLAASGEAPKPGYEDTIFIATLGEAAGEEGFQILSQLRTAGFSALMDVGAKSLKSQMRQADKHRARYAVILGDDEIAKKIYTVKNLETGNQEAVPAGQFQDHFKNLLHSKK